MEWKNNSVIMIDQTKLPKSLEYVTYTDYNDVAMAIKNLVIRGAPAIGVAGAFGLVLAALQSSSETIDDFLSDLEKAKEILLETRPTAINLSWGLEQIYDSAFGYAQQDVTVSEIKERLIYVAKQMAEEDVNINKRMGKNGAELFQNNDTIMTHCNAGALATVGYGTAVGVIRAAVENTKKIKIISTETRPALQGARLNSFELMSDGFDITLISDTMVGHTMKKGLVDKVLVGADRITKDGYVFNKIGTYQVALLAKEHKIPFYPVAPVSTFDFNNEWQDIEIEERDKNEIIQIKGNYIAPKNVKVFNPAFDVTPPELITGIITNKGILHTPYRKSIAKLRET